MAEKARKKFKVYVKAATPGVPAAFAAGDKMAEVSSLTVNIGNSTIEFDHYDADAAAQEYGADTAEVTGQAYFSRSNTILRRIATALQNKTYLDVLVVYGDAPGGGASNWCRWFRAVPTRDPFPAGEVAGLSTTEFGFQISDGTTLNFSTDQTTWPSL